MPPTRPDDPRRHPARTAALTGLVGPGAGGRTFVDHTGTAVPLPRPVRRVVTTDPAVAALLLAIGAAPAGTCDPSRLADVNAHPAEGTPGIADLGPAGRPDPEAVAALRPDAIVTTVRNRVPDVTGPGLLAALQRIAPVLALDVAGRHAHARADLRALLGPVAVQRPTAPPPTPLPPPRPPHSRPGLW